MFRSYNTIQAHPINQGEPELFYGLSNMTGCSTQEHPAWFASNSSYRLSFYFLIGNLYDNTISKKAITAGKREKSDQTIISTESVMEVGSMTVFPILSVIILAPAQPKKRAMSEPEIAVPNFCDIVPEENINPVAEAPKCSV